MKWTHIFAFYEKGWKTYQRQGEGGQTRCKQQWASPSFNNLYILKDLWETNFDWFVILAQEDEFIAWYESNINAISSRQECKSGYVNILNEIVIAVS